MSAARQSSVNADLSPALFSSPGRCGRRAALVCTMGGVLLLSGCGVTPKSGDASSPPSENAIERRAEKGPVKLFVRVSPREPRLSDLVEMDVKVESQPDVEIKPPAFGQAVGEFIVRDYTERPAQPGAGKRRNFHYQLEPAHAGKHLVRSVSIEFVDKRPNSERPGEPALIETDPLEVNVTSEVGNEAPSLANLQPMLPPRPVPQNAAIGWLVAAGVVVLLIILGVVALRRRKRRPIEPRRQTPEEIAQAALALLLAEKLPTRGLVKEFYLRLTGIVRQYVEDTTGIRRPSRRRRSSCATCDREPCFRRSGPPGSRNSWKRPTWSSTPASSRKKAKLTMQSSGRTSRQPEDVAGGRVGGPARLEKRSRGARLFP